MCILGSAAIAVEAGQAAPDLKAFLVVGVQGAAQACAGVREAAGSWGWRVCSGQRGWREPWAMPKFSAMVWRSGVCIKFAREMEEEERLRK